MKHAAPSHPKMQALAETLNIPLHSAVGIMEMLWHYAGTYTPHGDIGKVTDETISRAVDWRKKVHHLIDALISSGFVDRSEKHRLIIHDWPDHAEEFVKKRLRRAKDDVLPEYGRSIYDAHPVSRQNEDEVEHTRAGKARQGTFKETEVPKKNVANWRLDESYCRFRDGYLAIGAVATDVDWSEGFWCWTRLDFEQRLLAVDHVKTCDPAWIKLPKNYLASHEWTRPPRPSAKSTLAKTVEQI